MNTQRWIALGLFWGLAAIITSSLVLVPAERAADEEDVAVATTPNSDTEADFEETPEEAPVILNSADLTPTLDPAIQDILESLELDSLGVGDEPFVIRAGNFTVIDNLHRGRGTANVYRVNEERLALRFESFSVSDGPDLAVVLSQNDIPRTSADALLPTHVDLGPLKSAEGEQTYPIPPDTNFNQYRSVVIYSTSLNIIYTSAELEQVRGAGS